MGEPRIVSFGMEATGAAAVNPAASVKPAHAESTEPPASAVVRLLTLLGKNDEERLAVLRAAAADPLVLWFASLTSAERIAIVQSADQQLAAALGGR